MFLYGNAKTKPFINSTMADIKFYLEKRKDKTTGELITENVPILLFYSFGGQRLQYYTGHRIDAHKWDAENHKAKKGFAESSNINDDLVSLKSKVIELSDTAKALKIPLTTQYFKDGLADKVVVKQYHSFLQAYDEFMKASKLTKGEGTVRNLKSTLNILKEFSSLSGIRLEFSNIDQNFYNKFLEYCFTVRGVNNNYTGNLIKNLKAFLNYATEEEYNTNLAYKKKTFKKLVEEPEIIYLTWEELMRLYNFKFKKKYLEEARDVFCFGCFTGLRYGDIKALTPENIRKDFIVYRVEKTDENNSIPLNAYSSAILKKYKGFPARCLPVASEFKINEHLKEAFKVAKLKRSIQQTHYQGMKRITTKEPLYTAVTFHVSKKTFMTNFLAKGGSLTTAMAITGNKDMKTARRYFKVVDTLKSEEMTKVFGK